MESSLRRHRSLAESLDPAYVSPSTRAPGFSSRSQGRRPACHRVEKDRDRYGCIVAQCFVGGEDLSEWLALNGWAVAYIYYSYEYTRAETLARSGLRGI